MPKYLRRFSIALAILPLIAGTAMASGPAMFVCRGDSIARQTCCCPESQHRSSGPMSAPTLSSACCCDISQVNVPTIPAVLDSAARILIAHHEDLGPTPSAAVVALVSTGSAPPAFARAQPPPHAIPILLGKQSLLI